LDADKTVLCKRFSGWLNQIMVYWYGLEAFDWLV